MTKEQVLEGVEILGSLVEVIVRTFGRLYVEDLYQIVGMATGMDRTAFAGLLMLMVADGRIVIDTNLNVTIGSGKKKCRDITQEIVDLCNRN